MEQSASQPLSEEGVRRRLVNGPAVVLWLVGLVLLAILGFLVYIHPTFWPLEKNVADFIQGPHAIPCHFSLHSRTWIDTASDYVNKFNDPIPSVIIPGILGIVFLLFRGWIETLVMWITVATASVVWGGLTILVGRPRATPADGICMHRLIQAYSFPSGHVMHDVVLWGFVFYLTLTKPVRTSALRWLLPILQILMVVYVLIVGYARIEAGEHHFFDVLGGYLAGLLWLGIGIVVYQWLKYRWQLRQARRHKVQTA